MKYIVKIILFVLLMAFIVSVSVIYLIWKFEFPSWIDEYSEFADKIISSID